MNSELSNDTKETQSLIEKILKELRNKVLDLSSRNRLLKYSHSKKIIHLRVINTTVESIHNKLRENIPLTLVSLPVDHTLDNEIEIAKKHGINPDFDLKISEIELIKSNNTYVLCAFDRYQRNLNKISQTTKEDLRDLGVNTLYCALGFLEWYESDASEEVITSPLLLHPLLIKKNANSFEIQGIVDETTELNITLQKRLFQDFGISIPAYETNYTLEEYFSLVQDVINSYPRWKLRTFVTIGIFNFARLAIYKDLSILLKNPELVENHKTLRELLIGKKSKLQSQNNYDEIPEETFQIKSSPLLVTNADSSQYRAVIEACKGNNLVIEGPPGTGKSQTITNIIGALLAQNKTVLFISEKSAALNVVKKRLNECNLGEFCFEFHSVKSEKSQIYSSLVKRTKMKEISCINPEETIDILNKEIDVVENYLKEIKDSSKSSYSIYDMIWRKNKLILSENLNDTITSILNPVTIPNCEALSKNKFNEICDLLRNWQEILGTLLGSKYNKIEEHPLMEICPPHLLLESHSIKRLLEEITFEVTKSKSILTPLQSIQSNIFNLPFINIQNFYKQLLKIKSIDTIPHGTIINKLKRSDIKWVKLWVEKCKNLQYITQHFSKKTISQVAHRLSKAQELLTQLYSLQATLETSLGDLKNLEITLRTKQAKFQNFEKFISKIEDLLNVTCKECYSDSIISLETAKSILEETEHNVLIHRSNKFFSKETHKILTEFFTEFHSLKEINDKISSSYHTSILNNLDLLREDLAIFKKQKWFSFFTNKSSEAKQRFATLFNTNKKVNSREICKKIEELLTFWDRYQKFLHNPLYEEILGNLFDGLNTDIKLLESLIQFSQNVKIKITQQENFRKKLTEFLVLAPLGQLDKLKNIICSHNYNESRSLLTELQKISLKEILKKLEIQIESVTKTIKIWSDPCLSNLNYEEIKEILQYATEFYQLEEERKNNPIVRELILEQDLLEISKDLENAIDYVTIINEFSHDENHPEIYFLEPHQTFSTLQNLSEGIGDTLQKVSELLSKFERKTNQSGNKLRSLSIEKMESVCKDMLSALEEMPEWIKYWKLTQEMIQQETKDFLDKYLCLKDSRLPIDICFEYVFVKNLLDKAFSYCAPLNMVRGTSLDKARRQFAENDQILLEQNQQYLKNQLLSKKIDAGISSGSRKTWTNNALIQAEIVKQNPKDALAIRQLIVRAGKALQQLKPCFMMSPISVSQVLPLKDLTFDVVIIDEASQMRLENAVGAILRSHQLIVVGDSKQLPPTSFFSRSNENDEEEETENIESILDFCVQQFGMPIRLLWHYRSSCPQLIMFSNQQFYENELILFPSSNTNQRSVYSHYIEEGRYRTNHRTNPIEAVSIAKAVIDFILKNQNLSLGIITFNGPQRDLIQAEIERLIQGNPVLTQYQLTWDNKDEPLIIKNLETIQGDERDVIFISTLYGPDEHNCIHQRFGPINNESGWRRLNVLFTRARKRIELFTSMRPSDIKVNDHTKRGVKALRDYLDYATSLELPSYKLSGRPPDSDFEISVAAVLKNAGYEVEAQVGVAGFYIDIGVLDPKNPRKFLVGIECDGKTYHSLRSARDRDRLREEILKRHGWELIRIWSTDWFNNPRKEIQKLLAKLTELQQKNIVCNFDYNHILETSANQNENETDSVKR